MSDRGIEAKTLVDAKKETHTRTEAIDLLGSADRVVAARGKKVVEFDLSQEDPSSEDVLKSVLGPTGNLRAPTIVRGKTVLVGFNEAKYDELLNG